MKLPVKEKIIVLEFHDHSMMENGNVYEEVLCKTLGWLVDEDDLKYYLVTWAANGQIDGNAEGFSILKSAVVSKKFVK